MILANLIDIRSNVFVGKDGKEVKGLVPTFLVQSKDNKYPPNYVSCWVHADSQIGQILALSLGIKQDFYTAGEHITDIQGLGIFDVAIDFDKTKKLQHLKYCKVKED